MSEVLDHFIFRSLEEEIISKLGLIASADAGDISVGYWDDCPDDWDFPVYASWSPSGVDDSAFAVCDISSGTVRSQGDFLATQLFDYFYPVDSALTARTLY